MTKTKKMAIELKETITKKGMTKTMKKVAKLKEMITRKKMIVMEGDDQGGEEGDKIQKNNHKERDNVATLALGLRPKQGLARVRAKREA
jgi:hypothetical protein